MAGKTIYTLISKFFGNDIPEGMQTAFRRWFTSEAWQREKEEAMADIWEQTPSVADERTSAELDRMHRRIRNSIPAGNRRSLHQLLIRVAAVLLLPLLGVATTYFYFTQETSVDVEMIARSMEPIAETEDVRLVLPGKQIPISGQNSAIQYDSKGSVIVNSEKITETPATISSVSDSPIEYNQLIVPNGKRSTLTFEDGTKLWVNAGSRIVYPVAFATEKREIYVDGEVYLEVTPDKKRPFIVKTSDMSIRVLGTSFNVMSYEKDYSSSVVLVTGSVQVETKEKDDFHLTANKMLSYRDGEGNIKEVNIVDYISWKEGLYTYRSENLSVILDRLSRYYGEKITYNSGVGGLKCSGKLDMQGELGVVLDGLTSTAPVSWKKVGNEYVLEKRGKQ